MSGFTAVPNDAIAVCVDEDEEIAVFKLARLADQHRWGPFEATEDFLCARLGWGNRRVRSFLERLVTAGCLQVIKGGRRSLPQKLILACPTAQQGLQQDRSKDAATAQQGTVTIPPTSDAGAARPQQGRSKTAARIAATHAGEEVSGSSRPDPDDQTANLGENTPPAPSRPAAAGPVCAPSAPLPADPPPGRHPPSGDTVEAVVPPPRQPDPVADGAREAWRTYLAHHPTAGDPDGRGGRKPAGKDRDRLLGAIRAHGTADVLLLLEWVHLAGEDPRWPGATWLRGEAEKARPGGWLDLESLLRPGKWAARIESARAWAAAGRPKTGEGTALQPGARASPRPYSRACGAELDELLRHYEGEVIDTTFTVEAPPPKEPTWPLPQAS